MNVQDIRNQFIALKKQYPHGTTPGHMLELIGTSFIADEPYIFGTPNDEYIQSELNWYRKRSLNVNDIMPIVPKVWREVAAPDGSVNSNYGHLLFSEENFNQFGEVVCELQARPYSRRAVAIYTRPSMHIDATKDGKNDFVCTNAVNYFQRNKVLHAVVQMRSNDVVFGYRNDYAWQKYALCLLCDELRFAPGDIIWQAASLHIYPRHHRLVPTEP